MPSNDKENKKKTGIERVEQFLAIAAISVIGLSLVSMFISLISSLLGAKENLAILAQIPLLGLPLGFILVLVLLVTSLTRRSRENGN
ncbi:MAG: hypothetical protein RI933_653 [Actinomycetota bacterium]|jgi:formate hydrogenlyase subunit 3/multisubunit Na+/H+ antiporter MnhD subunit